MSVILVGENFVSYFYVFNKIRVVVVVGINSEIIMKLVLILEEELLNLINKLNNDDNVDGFFV